MRAVCNASARSTPVAAEKHADAGSLPVEAGDCWAVADLHACAFYPRSTPFWFSALRLDRVLSLQVGQERQQGDARFLCLVAEAPSSSSSSSSSQSSDGGEDSQSAAASSGSSVSQAADSPGSHAARPMQAAAEAAAAAGSGGGGPARVAVRDFLTPAGAQADSVDLGPLVAALVRLAFPPSMRQDYGASYSSAGLCGAVVIDTLGDFVPPKRRRMPNGTLRDVPRPGIAYLSNLAVAPCSRRGGIGTLLVREAEQVAAEWGCRSVALHVDPANTAALEVYRRAGYRRVSDQPGWQRILEGRSRPLALMMRVLPWELRQRARRAAPAPAPARGGETAAAQQ
ncbi:hypothetical protein ABPG77_010212 [Micractinium sp. CCAP 211/92]